MKVAIVHDWLTGMRGGEKVLESLCDLFPDAPIFTLIHLPGSVSSRIESHRIHTSFVQRFPFLQNHYRNYLPFFPSAVQRFHLQDYDLILSSSHCVAKGAIPSPSALHISYCHTPMRYIWSHYQDYFGNRKIGFLKRATLPAVLKYLRGWDVSSCSRVHQFVANSQAVAGRIARYYGREARIIYPPVDVDYYTPSNGREDFYLIVSALVPYKRIEVAVEAFRQIRHRLLIVGTGPEQNSLRKLASSNIHFLGKVNSERLRDLYRKAIALIQPGEEDFGISIVEALACGCPVVAYAAGGALETVVDGETGLFFNELSVENLRETVDKAGSLRFNKALMRRAALRFSPDRFQSEFQSLIQEKLRSTDHASKEK
jgi:glycosyltransferase involved in cell wall biosynthesis